MANTKTKLQVIGGIMSPLVGAYSGAIGGNMAGEVAYKYTHPKYREKLTSIDKSHLTSKQKNTEIKKLKAKNIIDISKYKRLGTLGGMLLGGHAGTRVKSKLHQAAGAEWARANPGYNNYRSRGAPTDVNSARSVLGLGGVKTKAEAKKRFRNAAIKNHPDRGGTDEAMKRVNSAWTDIQKSGWFNKLAFLKGFEKQLELAKLEKSATVITQSLKKIVHK